ncbi:hypothetical protein [Streptomyces sp. CC210A]|uniref:hypothetical protein n=1 Tax=Streptomyces sp. CC210A TaxID=2898184 RepID=UPI001F3CB85D|nr:hypothetical protein [Streptomyces sp. CC210A]
MFLSAAVLLTGATAGTLWVGVGTDDEGDAAAACSVVLAEVGLPKAGTASECGDALEEAIIGRPAGRTAPAGTTEALPAAGPATLEAVVNFYAPKSGTASHPMPEHLRENLANALTYYRSDVYQILSSQVSYASETFSTEPNDIDLDKQDMGDFLVLLAPDEAAFRSSARRSTKRSSGR